MRLILALGILLLSNAAFAETWLRYAQTSDEKRYVDKERTIFMGGTAFILDLHELKTAAVASDGKPYRSVLHAVEVNCREGQQRLLNSRRMSGEMGKGTVVEEHSMVGAWSSPSAQMPETQLMLIACEQK